MDQDKWQVSPHLHQSENLMGFILNLSLPAKVSLVASMHLHTQHIWNHRHPMCYTDVSHLGIHKMEKQGQLQP